MRADPTARASDFRLTNAGSQAAGSAAQGRSSPGGRLRSPCACRRRPALDVLAGRDRASCRTVSARTGPRGIATWYGCRRGRVLRYRSPNCRYGATIRASAPRRLNAHPGADEPRMHDSLVCREMPRRHTSPHRGTAAGPRQRRVRGRLQMSAFGGVVRGSAGWLHGSAGWIHGSGQCLRGSVGVAPRIRWGLDHPGQQSNDAKRCHLSLASVRAPAITSTRSRRPCTRTGPRPGRGSATLLSGYRPGRTPAYPSPGGRSWAKIGPRPLRRLSSCGSVPAARTHAPWPRAAISARARWPRRSGWWHAPAQVTGRDAARLTP